MNCNHRICERLVISNSVTFANGNLVINIPQDNYCNNHRYCLVVAQNIPTTTTINAPVMITIGASPTLYPLTNYNCTTVRACSIRTRRRYPVRVRTDMGSGVFTLTERISCNRCTDFPKALPITTTTQTPTL